MYRFYDDTYILFGMHKPRRFFINYKPIVNFCTMSFWVSIYICSVFIIFVYIFIFCLPNKLYIIIIIIIFIYNYAIILHTILMVLKDNINSMYNCNSISVVV